MHINILCDIYMTSNSAGTIIELYITNKVNTYYNILF